MEVPVPDEGDWMTMPDTSEPMSTLTVGSASTTVTSSSSYPSSSRPSILAIRKRKDIELPSKAPGIFDQPEVAKFEHQIPANSSKTSA